MSERDASRAAEVATDAATDVATGMRRWRRPGAGQRLAPWLVLAVLPFIVHLPALTGWLRFDPLYVYSGVNTGGSWITNGVLPGYPGWVDGNAGVTTEAMGTLVAHDWLRGIIPWWNPYAGAGLPLAAEQQAAPFFLPFILVMAMPHGLLALKIAMLLIAGFSSFALLRTMRLMPLAALAGAVLFQLNGSFAWQSHAPIMPVAFLPMILLGLEQARAGRLPIWTGLGVAWTLLAGFPETAFFNLVLGLAWGALRLIQTPGQGRLVYAMRTIGAAGSGVLIAAPAIWPFFEALPRSHLGVHAVAPNAHFDRDDLAALLFPYVYGNIFAYGLQYGGRVLGIWWTLAGYCDLVLLGVALVGVRTRARETALRLALAAWVAVTFARAVGFPGLPALFDAVPLMKQARFSLYILPSWSMALSVLAALAVDDYARGQAPRILPRMLVAAALAGAALALGLGHVAALWRKLPAYAPFPILSVLASCGLLTWIASMLMRPPATRRAALLALAIVANATLLFGLPSLAGTHGRRLDAAGLRLLRTRAGLSRAVSFGPLIPNYGSMFGIAEIDSNTLPTPRNWVDYVRAHFDPGMDGVNFYYHAVPPGRALGPLLEALQRAGVGFALASPGDGAWLGAFGADRLAGTPVMDIWALPHPAPYFQADGCALVPWSRTALQVACPAAARLIRRELVWPGWRATVSGHAVAVRPAEEIFQAIDLPPGSSAVRFAYAPPGTAWACLACAAGIAGLLLPGLTRRRVQTRIADRPVCC